MQRVGHGRCGRPSTHGRMCAQQRREWRGRPAGTQAAALAGGAQSGTRRRRRAAIRHQAPMPCNPPPYWAALTEAGMQRMPCGCRGTSGEEEGMMACRLGQHRRAARTSALRRPSGAAVPGGVGCSSTSGQWGSLKGGGCSQRGCSTGCTPRWHTRAPAPRAAAAEQTCAPSHPGVAPAGRLDAGHCCVYTA